jgi:hypothetical protein
VDKLLNEKLSTAVEKFVDKGVCAAKAGEILPYFLLKNLKA